MVADARQHRLAQRAAMNQAVPSIVFAGGGTLGHLFPGLAVADALRDLQRMVRIHFAGRGTANERRFVEEASCDFHRIPCHPWPRRPWAAARFLASNLCGFTTARRMLRNVQADVVVGLGGYGSAPVGRAAISLHIPLVLLEQNAVPGRVSRWLSRHAGCVCTSFGNQATWRCERVCYTGNPVRRSFIERQVTRPREKLLVVTGGSLGASALNAAVPEALARLKVVVDGWRIVHQTGEREVKDTRERYRQLGLAAEVTAFADLPSLLPRASLALCRAGGSTIAELLATGTPAVLCPYPHASDDHQRHNAAALGEACRVVEQQSPDFAGRLANELALLLGDAPLRARMSQAMLGQSRPRAACEVANLLLGFAQRACL
jgi:UDP-N-acetylglucosamine--N-acetylmuramyl-(pentapeptide) pyrophosphoryl-undecaprenol N-acetylglucosamine transferase